jgi:phage-related protein
VDKVMPPLVKAFEAAVPVIVRLDGIISAGLSAALKFLMPYALQAGQAVADFAGQIADRVLPIVTQFWDKLNVGLTWLQANWKYIWPTLSSVLKSVWDEIAGVVQIAWSLVSGIIKIGLDLMSGNWKQVWLDTLDMFKGVWSGILSIAKGFIDQFLGFFQGLYDKMIGHSIIPDLVNGIVGWFTQMVPRAMSAVGSVCSQIGAAFSGLASQAVSWGANLIGGLIAGIQNGIGGIGNVMSNVVSTIGSWLPHSPAKQGELSPMPST